MRRRVVRDVGTLLGIAVILAFVVFLNGYISRGTLTDKYDRVRRVAEQQQRSEGLDLIPWELMRKTKGTKFSGPTFDAALAEKKESQVSLIGFMVNLYEVRQMSEFLLLPLPIECYFCQSPPLREVVLVQMAKDVHVDLVKEPVLITGTLTLNEGPGTKFFYVMKDATRDAAEKGQKLHKKAITQDHVMHSVGAKQAEEAQQTPLIEGQEPPKAPSPAPK